jgi:hypothetical protein
MKAISRGDGFFYFWGNHLVQCRASPFTLFLLPHPFGAMQSFSFYPFSASSSIWGNAALLLLPFFCFPIHLGQCSTSAFTLFLLAHPFGVMQRSCFYPFSAYASIWGNATLLLLPFFSFLIILGQCRASAFTLFLLTHPFGAMQRFCFYPFSVSASFWGNAELLLLPFFCLLIHLGQCSAPAFTLFLFPHHFGAIQSSCFYPFSASSSIWGNAALLLLPFFCFLTHLGQRSVFPNKKTEHNKCPA